jgi:acetyltransferase-like isoleucine patch superfamily enzyme
VIADGTGGARAGIVSELLFALRGGGRERSVGPGARRIRRVSIHNACGLLRWVLLRLRFRNLQAPVFFVGSGAQIDIGPRARVHIGRGVRFIRDFECRWFGEVRLADGVYFSRGCVVSVHSGLSVGPNTGFAEWVSIHDNDHDLAGDSRSFLASGFVESPIVIGENVWVGAKATILKGARIGDNSVIGAHAVVTGEIPANVVAAGIPAKVIRAR